LRTCGAELVAEMERYEDSYRLCYVRGPEGIIVELAAAGDTTGGIISSEMPARRR
jgi:hypothetical protein